MTTPVVDTAAAPPGRWHRRRGPRSLTARLVTGVVALVVIVVLIISTSTYFALKYFLDTKLQEQLQQTSKQNSGFFDRCIDSAFQVGVDRYRCEIGPQTDTEYVLAYNPSSNVTYRFMPGSYSKLRPLQLSSAQQQSLVNNSNQTITVTQNGEQLLATADLANDGLLVVTGLPTEDVHNTLARLVAIELIISAAAVVIAVMFTTYGVGFGLRQLRRVTTTAQEVAAELSPEGAGLDRRVPDDEPDTEVGQLATSFNMMLAAVEMQFAARVESEQRMRQFLADASHELRTPLTSIRGYAELARMQRAVGDASDDNIDRIESEGTRMSRLVEDLLTLARGDADGSTRVRRELVDVDIVLDDAVSGSRAAFPERTVTAEMHGTPQVIGDPDQLLRVIRNLVTNAAVHTAPDRPIVVRGWGEGENVIVQVVDGGPGLAPEDAAHVFERFWRADKARTRARGGSGLGLSIVATIIRAHGGSVRFDSTVDAGSTVTVVLPSAESGEVGAEH